MKIVLRKGVRKAVTLVSALKSTGENLHGMNTRSIWGTLWGQVLKFEFVIKARGSLGKATHPVLGQEGAEID